ncbi:MAG TPA: divalent-cation tolerance protein CutA [Burkholderiales bacterium]|nr:divalent-cation tolerance protein CutA [Burkholderiales bacterium]
MDAILVITNLPDRDSALGVAEQLVTERLAACVNMLGECTSVYRWKGEMERAAEVTLLIKTRAALYPRVEAAIRALHPYELPEIVAVPISAGLPGYLQWIAAETAAPQP